jgi:hypothetical protein
LQGLTASSAGGLFVVGLGLQLSAFSGNIPREKKEIIMAQVFLENVAVRL